MRFLIAYHHEPYQRLFPFSGLQVLGYNFAKGLRNIGQTVEECNIFNYEDYTQKIQSFNPDIVLPCGSWLECEYFGIPKLMNFKTIPIIVSEGQVPKQPMEMLNKLDGVVTISSACDRIFQRDGMTVPTFVVYPGIDIKLFRASGFTGSIEEQNDLLNKKKILSHWLHANTTGDRVLLHSLKYVKKEIPNVMLFDKIQYSATIEHLGWARKLVKDEGVEENVQFVNVQVPYSMMPDIYNLADIYASLGGTIGFEFPFAEAMSCMRPCVGLNHGTAPEIIKDGVNGFLTQVSGREKRMENKGGFQVEEEYCYPDPQEVAEKITKLLGNDNYRRILGMKAYRYVNENFELNKQAGKLLKVLEGF